MFFTKTESQLLQDKFLSSFQISTREKIIHFFTSSYRNKLIPITKKCMLMCFFKMKSKNVRQEKLGLNLRLPSS